MFMSKHVLMSIIRAFTGAYHVLWLGWTGPGAWQWVVRDTPILLLNIFNLLSSSKRNVSEL